MNFYEQLSLYYDEVFPASKEEMTFIASCFSGCTALLDLGCGTGNKTVHLAGPGRRILGIDLDAGMIEQARKTHAFSGMDYAVMDMAKAPELLPQASFDGALCLGNTLVHLDQSRGIAAFLKGVAGLLRADAPFVIQIVNYDRILDQGVTRLPDLEGEHVVFERRYAADGSRLRFITSLRLKNGSGQWENDVPLYPLRKDEFAALLNDAGFAQVDWRGGFDGSALTDSSFALLAVARP